VTAPLRAGTNRYPNDKILAKVPTGTKLKISGTVGEWYRTSYSGKTGFVFRDNLSTSNRNSFAVYGTLRAGHYVVYQMNGYTQRDLSTRLHQMQLWLWKKLSNPNNDATVVTTGPGKVVAEQYLYSKTKGPQMYKKLDGYESYYKVNGHRAYTAKMKAMTDQTKSWTFAANPTVAGIIKAQSYWIVKSGDFDDRRRH
jgi:gamma-glutamylcyclotransferase (GGCT)/AIG2-like uncharacterized protein YtfP